MEKVILSGVYKGEVFENKLLSYAGGDLDVSGCKIDSCEFEVIGKAGDGVQFLKAMFDDGAKCSVMKTFLNDEEYEKVKKALGWEGKDGN